MKSLAQLLILFVFVYSASAQTTFNKAFAPQEGLVKSVEKPYRYFLVLLIDDIT